MCKTLYHTGLVLPVHVHNLPARRFSVSMTPITIAWVTEYIQGDANDYAPRKRHVSSYHPSDGSYEHYGLVQRSATHNVRGRAGARRSRGAEARSHRRCSERVCRHRPFQMHKALRS